MAGWDHTMCYPILLLLFSFCFASPATYTLQSLRVSGTQPTSSSSAGAEYYSILKLGIADLNSNPNILPNTELFFDSQVHNGMPSVAVAKTIEFSDNNITFVIGHVFSSIAVLTGVVGDVYGVAQLSNSATSSVLSDKATYPYFSRMAPPGPGQVDAIIETILYYDDLQGGGWRNIAIIATADAFGIDTAETMIAKSQDIFTIAAYQQYIKDPGSFDVELSEIVKSKARVITAFVISNWAELIAAANEYQLVNENHVWIVPDSVTFATFQDDDTTALLSRGVLGTFQYIPNADESETVREFVDRWLSLDPEEYYGNNVPPSLYGLLSYDMVQVAGLALQAIDEMGELDVARVKPEIYTQAVRNVSYVGLSGAISFDEKGDRISEMSILYYDYEQRAWVKSAIYSPTEGLIYLRDVVWFSNTTEIPDLDIRDPFHYWSCHEKELGYDSTGKAIQIQTPGSSDVDDIDSTYHCDRFIDCWNLSDESVDCSSNYLVVFIVFGIITGCLIMISILMLFLTFIFGIVLKWRRFRVSSPVFMIIVILSIIVGYSSIFAWFGKPHPVACGFQPWLLGLSSISMISALSAKTFRIWRIFRKKMSRLKISDIELLALWLAIMIPAVVILTLWTIISTPTATLKNRDGEDHYVCATGGFTGEPGGIIFFCILISYGAIVLLIGAFLSIVTRKVPSMFNESKLLAVSIYNLVLLSVVVIPVFMVIQPYNPFLAWILRTCAILYAFTAVLVLQFVPQIFSVIVFDRCKDNRVFRSQLRSVPSNTTPSTNQYSDNSSDN